MLTRKQIIDTIEAYDAEIQALQDSKRDTYEEQRAALTAADGKEVARAEIDGLKKAVQRRRQVAKHGVEAVEQKDALVEEILAEVANAPRATRESAKTVPITEPATAPTPQSVAAAVEAQPLGIAGEAVALASPAPIQPETANSTQPQGQSGKSDNAGGENEAVARSPIDTGTAREEAVAAVTNDDSVRRADASEMALGSDVETVAQNSTVVRLPPPKPLRPYCLSTHDLSKCGGYGKVHCHECLKAHAEGQGMSA